MRTNPSRRRLIAAKPIRKTQNSHEDAPKTGAYTLRITRHLIQQVDLPVHDTDYNSVRKRGMEMISDRSHAREILAGDLSPIEDFDVEVYAA